MPEITVLMPVRNGEKYIKDAINSVLRQTLTDFELLIIDDGSTDRTVEIIQGYTDQRIRLEKREHQFIPNLNEGIKLASAPYIARMDADDIMHGLDFLVTTGRRKTLLILDMGSSTNLYSNYLNIICYFILA